MSNAFPNELLAKIEASQVAAGFSLEDATDAVPLARALLAGGIHVIELLLRAPGSMDAVRAICAELPEMVVGVGTILTPEQAVEVAGTGAHFGVSPGMNPRVVGTALDAGLPFAPGICTPSDIEAALAFDCRFLKFFPAEVSGGVRYLKAMSAPYRHLDLSFLCLGGIHAENMNEYLNEPHVAAIGGSWIVKQELVEARDWDALAERARGVREALA